MHSNGHSAHEGQAALATAAAVQQNLQQRHEKSGNMFRLAVLFSAGLLVLGVIGFILRIADGVSDTAMWGYYAAAFAFVLSTAVAAPMVAIAPRIAKAHWRRPISRIAELFGIVGIFNLLLFIPLIWVLPPLDNGRRTLWFFDMVGEPVPNYSPHIWATLAILALAAVGVMLLWVSALPDFAALRDRTTGRKQKMYAWLARGWYGTTQQWHMQKHRLGILGAFYFMMFIFVHFLITVDFLMALVPGWIDALYPVTHAASALQAGAASVIIVMVILRQWGGYKEYIGLDQFWGLGKLLFALSLLWIWFWFSSFNIFWFGRKPNEISVLELFIKGPYLPLFYAVFVLSFAFPLFFMIWNPIRKSIWGPTVLAVGVLIGIFLDRIRMYVAGYSVADQSPLHAMDHVPVANKPDIADIFILFGAIGGSILIYLLASRLIPIVSIWEQKELLLYKLHKPFHRTHVRVMGKPD
ncbi:MAG: hypothetical protein FJ312_00890 [SAR202 cluster bacterium]|nr:hypothetical protein [SAR202 cluster bacterium]